MEHDNVDTTKTITHVGLCAGYGGIELGLKRVLPTLRSVALCEIEAFAIANLVAKMEAGLMDAAPVWTDLKTFPWESFRDRVDILTGGYPCQPFSAAGKRAGKDDPRHLWPWIADGIRLMRPRVCFFENVEGHISLGLSSVISDLEELGYTVSWNIFSASVDAGAPHQRKRVFIMAHREDKRFSGRQAKQWKGQNWEKRTEVWNQFGRQSHCNTELAKPSGIGSKTGGSGSITRHEGEPGVVDYCGDQAWPSRPGQPQHAWEPPRVVGNSECIRRAATNGNNGGVEDQKCQEEGAESKSWDTAQAVDSAGYRAEEPFRVVGNPNSDRRECDVPRDASQQDSHGQDNGVSGKADTMGNADGAGSQEWSRERGAGVQRADADGRTDAKRQAEPTLGGDADGVASGLDYAQLCVTCDNRTDELRLLGNGVVPATAALAFITLLNEQRNTRHLA